MLSVVYVVYKPVATIPQIQSKYSKTYTYNYPENIMNIDTSIEFSEDK